jgi:uncharacterized membrane protein
MSSTSQSYPTNIESHLETAEPASIAGAARVPRPRTAVDAELDKFILTILGMIILLLGILLIYSLTTQWAHYYQGMNVALSGPVVDHSAALTYARASDAAGIKLTATFLGFLLIFTGALYVLRHAKTEYQAGASKGDMSANLRTSSPGLVVVTLGVVLVGLAILTKPDVGYYYSSTPTDSTASGDSAPASGSSTNGEIQPGQAQSLPAHPAQSLQ